MAHKAKRERTFLREWRKHKGLSLERVSEWLELEKGMTLSVSQLSRIERGEQPYNQDLLEALADIYGAKREADLIIRDPTDPQGIWSIWDQIPETQRPQAMAVLEALRKAG